MPFLLSTCIVLCWGSTWIAIKLQKGIVAPELAVSYRMAIAGTLLLLWCLFQRKSLRFSAKNHFYIAMLGLTNFCVNYILLYIASHYLTSGINAVAFSLLLPFNMMNSALIFKTPLDRQSVGAAFLGICGLCCIFWPEISDLDFSDGNLKGLAWALAGTFLASVGNMFATRNQRQGLPIMQTNALGMLYAAFFAFLIVLVLGRQIVFDTSLVYSASLLYLALVGTILAFGCYFKLLSLVGAGRAAYPIVVVPVVALIVSQLFESFVWTPNALWGVVLILAGNILILYRKSKTAVKVKA